MTHLHTVPAVTAALIANGTVTVLTAAEQVCHDGRILIRADDAADEWIEDDVGDYQRLPGGDGSMWLRHLPTWKCRRSDHGDDHALIAAIYPEEHPDWWVCRLHPGCIVASAEVEWVPIHDHTGGAGGSNDHPWFCVDARHLPDGHGALLWSPFVLSDQAINLSDQLPYGDFTRGRWAGILTDVKPTAERCPACWGRGIPTITADMAGKAFAAVLSEGKGAGRKHLICPTCDGAMTCPPIPCPDQGEWL